MTNRQLTERFHEGADEDDMFAELYIAFEKLAVDEVGRDWIYGLPLDFDLQKTVTIPLVDPDDEHPVEVRDERARFSPRKYAERYTFRFWGSQRQSVDKEDLFFDTYELGVAHTMPMEAKEVPLHIWPRLFETFVEIDPEVFEELSEFDESDVLEDVEINLDSISLDALIAACLKIAQDKCIPISQSETTLFALDSATRYFQADFELSYMVGTQIIPITQPPPEEEGNLLVHGEPIDENEFEVLSRVVQVPTEEERPDSIDVAATYGSFWADMESEFGEYDVAGTPFWVHAMQVMHMMANYRQPQRLMQTSSEHTE